MCFYLETIYLKFNQKVPSRLKYIGLGHLGYRLHHATVILGIAESKVLTCKEKIIKREGEEGRGQGAVACAWGDHDTGSKSQRNGNLGNGGKSEEWLYRHKVS